MKCYLAPVIGTILIVGLIASDANAQAALRNSDFTTYGQEQKALESDLARLRALTGQ